MKQSVVRLFESFKPEKYSLELSLDPAGKKFEGTVSVRGCKTGRPSKRITFHAKDLIVTRAVVHRLKTKGNGAGSVEVKITRVNLHKTYDEVRLHSDELIYPGQYQIVLEFKGRITDPMNGIYPCYFTEQDKQKFLLATQFESHYARAVFPCIDEPEAKATFDLVLKTPQEGTVIANTPAKSSLAEKGVRTTIFETTPIMSTYLLAFVYGDIKFKEAKTKNGTLVRTYATSQNVAHTGFALDVALKCLEFYEDYFGIPYPLAKCDMVALPDFASGAMENWGLITYREQTLLVDSKNTSLSVKQYVAMVVAHELAHQWFGNLVTMRWWTDLWLNEGFASWIEYLAVNELFPDWQMWTQFVVDEQQPALKLDALDNTHPIEVPINHPDEIHSIFDAISYSKGASVIHMLYAYLGANTFREGLRHYLKANAYKNADTKDLWQSLETVSKKPVKDFMASWTEKPGFPILELSQQNSKTILSQTRFYAVKPNSPSKTTWPVPVLGPAGYPEQFETSQTVLPKQQFSKINQGQSGFYRTLYDQQTVTNIIAEIYTLSPIDRLGLLADSFEAAKAGLTPTTNALMLLPAYKNETNAAVWDIIASNLVDLRRIMDDDRLREAIKPFMIKLTAKELKRLGWAEKAAESYFDKLLRPTILGLNSGVDNSQVIEKCTELFSKADRSEDLPADLRAVVYSTVARNGDEKVFNKLFDFYNNTTNSEEKLTLASALTNFKQKSIHQRVLAMITSDQVRRQDALYWLAYSFNNHYSKHAAWEWLKTHWNWLEKELGDDLGFYRTPIYAGRSFSENDFLKEYKTFFNAHSSPALARSIKQGEELLLWQISFKKRELDSLIDYFRKSKV